MITLSEDSIDQNEKPLRSQSTAFHFQVGGTSLLMQTIVELTVSGENIGYVIINSIIGAVVLTIVGLISLNILGVFAQAEAFQNLRSREILDSAAMVIVLIVIIGLPGAGLFIHIMSRLP